MGNFVVGARSDNSAPESPDTVRRLNLLGCYNKLLDFCDTSLLVGTS